MAACTATRAAWASHSTSTKPHSPSSARTWPPATSASSSGTTTTGVRTTLPTPRCRCQPLLTLIDIVSGLRIAREPFSFPTFCDFSFFCGDLNYRVTAPRDKVLDAVKTGRYGTSRADALLFSTQCCLHSLKVLCVSMCVYMCRVYAVVVATPLRRTAEELLVEEQLNAERSAGNCFAEFKEGSIRFQPTYRYNRSARSH